MSARNPLDGMAILADLDALERIASDALTIQALKERPLPMGGSPEAVAVVALIGLCYERDLRRRQMSDLEAEIRELRKMVHDLREEVEG